MAGRWVLASMIAVVAVATLAGLLALRLGSVSADHVNNAYYSGTWSWGGRTGTIAFAVSGSPAYVYNLHLESDQITGDPQVCLWGLDNWFDPIRIESDHKFSYRPGGSDATFVEGRFPSPGSAAGSFRIDFGGDCVTEFYSWTASTSSTPAPTPTPSTFSLSSDIIFQRGTGRGDILRILDFGQGAGATFIVLRGVTDDPNSEEMPAWSPDGSKVAFVSDRDSDGDREIFVIDVDGSNWRKLTDNSVIDDSPAWSTDGSKIAFVSLRDGNGEIYVMDADGSNQTRLTNSEASDTDPAWAPDGSSIVFASNRDGDYEIFVMDADGSRENRVTNNSASDRYPTWSPDGSRIAFASDRDGDYEIFVMNADGSSQTRLTTNSELDTHPKWSPDGTLIAFASSVSGDMDIWVMNADGSQQIRITRTADIDIWPSWQPGAAPPPPPPPTATPTPAPTPAPTPTPSPGPGGMVSLVGGWAPVPYSGSTRPVEQALGNCLASVEAVFFWNTAIQAYSWWFRGASAAVNTLADLAPGRVYWVRAAAACAWQQT